MTQAFHDTVLRSPRFPASNFENYKTYKVLEDQILSSPAIKPTKKEWERLEALGLIEPFDSVGPKAGYASSTPELERISHAIKHQNFYNSMGKLGSMFAIFNEKAKRVEFYIYGYVSGCFMPFFYRLHY